MEHELQLWIYTHAHTLNISLWITACATWVCEQPAALSLSLFCTGIITRYRVFIQQQALQSDYKSDILIIHFSNSSDSTLLLKQQVSYKVPHHHMHSSIWGCLFMSMSQWWTVASTTSHNSVGFQRLCRHARLLCGHPFEAHIWCAGYQNNTR